ncbi:hypothetical protein BH10ACI1_BH10ACI1_20610 [soil metagenome]
MKEKMNRNNQSENGGASVKLVAVLVVLILVGYAGFNFIPVAYQGASFKEEMQTAILQGTVLPNRGDPVGATKLRLRQMADSNNVPQDAVIEVKQLSGRLEGRAIYSKKVNILPFGLYAYNYQFDYTATPSGFLTK